MSNTNKLEQEAKPAIISPMSKTCNLIENVNHNTILSLSVDINEDDENSIPLDYRRDWSYDLDDANQENKEHQPASAELYKLLQKTIATIDPDEFSDVGNDDASCDSLPIYIPSDIFDEPLDKDVGCKKNKLLKALYHDKSYSLVENNSVKRRKLN